MIRLAVAGVDDATLRDLGRRLQPVRLVRWPSEDVDAVAILGPCDADPRGLSEATQWQCTSHRPLLICGEVVPGDMSTDASDPAVRVRNLERYFPSRQLIRQQLEAGKL